MKKAIIFDLEGVIVDSEPLWTKVDEEFARRQGFPYNEEEWKPILMGRSLEEGAKMYKERFELSAEVEGLGPSSNLRFLGVILSFIYVFSSKNLLRILFHQIYAMFYRTRNGLYQTSCLESRPLL